MRLNNKWMTHHGTLVRCTLASVALLLLLFTFCKRCTQMGGPAAKEVYVPAADKGFVMKANQLLAHLVAQGDAAHPDVKPHSITELQRRYPALEFALPYGGDAVEGARAADIRLVGLKADSILDSDDRRFYYNSDIPSLLERQRSQLGERIFRIKFANTDYLTIDRIEVSPAMFKLALKKDPWEGDVVATDNALFPMDSHCFLAWGKSVVPIRQSGRGHIATGGGHEKVVTIDETTHTLAMRDGSPVNLYALHKAYQADTTTLCLRMPGKAETAVYIDYLDSCRVRVRPVGCYCLPYDEAGPLSPIVPLSSAMTGQVYPLQGVMKLVLSTKKGGGKLCELMLTRNNPMLQLSTLVHSNQGRTRYNIPATLTDRFTQQVMRGLNSTLRNTIYKDTVHLTLDPLLSMEMEHELARYARKLRNNSNYYKDDQWELSLTVLDMATGAVVAAPYYRSADEGLDYELALSRKNPALTRRFVGSAFKPLAALAAVLTKPSLANLSTTGSYSLMADKGGKRKALFYGHETSAWSEKGSAAGFWGGCSSMSSFIAHSDDVYPVALVAKALNYGESGSPFKFGKHEVYLESNNSFTWAGSRFVTTLDHLYTIPSMKEYLVHDSLQMGSYTWDNLGLEGDATFGMDNVSSDPTLFAYEKFNAPGATMQRELVTWVLGQGTNEWNCLKLAEAWSRMLTKRKVTATFVTPRKKPAFKNLAEGYDDGAWNSLLASLLTAQANSPKLLTPMYTAVKNLNKQENIADTLLLFSKTGTPENYPRMEWKSVTGGPRWLDIGLYCMALMPSSAYRAVRRGDSGSGLMCVVRVTRIVSNKHRRLTANGTNNNNGIQSSDARDFFAKNPALLTKFYQLTKPYLQAPQPDNKEGKATKKKTK